MIYLCRCGKFKDGHPYHSAATKRWLCPACKEIERKVNILLLKEKIKQIFSKFARMAER